MITFSKTFPWYTSFILLLLLLQSPHQTKAQIGLDVKDDTLTQRVLIHPVIEGGHLQSSEHTYKEHLRLGDQLGRDFAAVELTDNGFTKRFENEGKTNKDWFSWRKNVLAPFDAIVTRVNHPDTTNIPGQMNREAQPGLIFFQNKDSVTVIYAHAREIKVEEGQQVKAGEIVAKVGNNGNSRNPHIHVGAWKKNTPLQIQVDLYAAERDEKEAKQVKKP